MRRIDTISKMQTYSRNTQGKGKSIGFVPTMGYLHKGHLSLIKKAKEEADVVVVSIFLNPKQFGPNEDLANYPKDLEKDLKLCRSAGADIVFVPSEEEIYPAGFSTEISENRLSEGLCGISRPVHFKGVLTILAKLFHIVLPTVTVFGQKDAQQVAVVRKMVTDLSFPVEIIEAPTVREKDGLAMSSRNRYLSKTQREDACIIQEALKAAKKMVDSGTLSIDRVVAETTHIISSKRRMRIIYISMVDRVTLEPVKVIEPGKCLLAAAVWVDEIRLIDNIIL
ncbi:MAG: pantoate--beta-alanine ligase [Opitutaceae bacterium]|nr:pantoate--beta-alanine ligase [Opitutaceae bacterium]